ncbi:hypothetical protein J7L01_03760 [bacterium]|nr:hypothetical protein [bacterium]
MKKAFLLLLVIPFVFVMMGSNCDDPVDAIGAPNALQLAGATNEIDLVITWSPPSSTSDIDGYRVYFDGATEPLWQGTATTFTHISPTLGSYEIVAYKGSDESDPLSFNTEEDYLIEGTFTVYDMDAAIGFDSGVGFNSSGVVNTYSMSDDGNGPVVDFYYDSDGTFTSANYLGGVWVNSTGFKSTSETWTGLEVMDISGYSNATPTAVALNQIWQVVLFKNNTDTWNYAKFRIDATETTPNVSATVTYKIQTIEGWARID